jgi:tRNA-binding EMAP/Myf-like protein
VIVTVVMLDVEAGVIRSIYTVRNPDKLSRLDVRCGG